MFILTLFLALAHADTSQGEWQYFDSQTNGRSTVTTEQLVRSRHSGVPSVGIEGGHELPEIGIGGTGWDPFPIRDLGPESIHIQQMQVENCFRATSSHLSDTADQIDRLIMNQNFAEARSQFQILLIDLARLMAMRDHGHGTTPRDWISQSVDESFLRANNLRNYLNRLANTQPEPPTIIENSEQTYNYRFQSPVSEFRNQIERQYSDLYNAHPQSLERIRSQNYGLRVTEFADQSYAQGDQDLASFYQRMGRGFLDIAVGLDPVSGFARSSYELISGNNLITGQRLSSSDRSMAFVGVATLGGSRWISQSTRGIIRLYQGAARIFARAQEAQQAIQRGRQLMNDNARTLGGWGRNHRITGFEDAEAANARLGGLPSYQPQTQVIHFNTGAPSRFIRVHGPTNQNGNWVVRSGEIRGMNPTQIRNHLNLPRTPTHFSEVNVPAETSMTRGATNFNTWGGNEGSPRIDGQVQFRIELEEVPRDWFSDMQRLGERFL